MLKVQANKFSLIVHYIQLRYSLQNSAKIKKNLLIKTLIKQSARRQKRCLPAGMRSQSVFI